MKRSAYKMVAFGNPRVERMMGNACLARVLEKMKTNVFLMVAFGMMMGQKISNVHHVLMQRMKTSVLIASAFGRSRRKARKKYVLHVIYFRQKKLAQRLCVPMHLIHALHVKKLHRKKMCASLSNCEWDKKDGMCAQGSGEVTCKDIKKAPACKKEEGCMWKKNKCVEEVVSEECKDIKKPPVCKKTDGCRWNPKKRNLYGRSSL